MGCKLVPGDRVAILSENRPEWAVVDYAALALGLVVVPVYPTLPADQVAFILRDSGARAVFASSVAQLEKILPLRSQLPALERVFGFDRDTEGGGNQSLARLLESGSEVFDNSSRALRKRALGLGPESLATIIYTSGTTGTPKGVILTHYNIAAMIAASRQHGSLPVRPGMVALSLLPLSHVLERGGDY